MDELGCDDHCTTTKKKKKRMDVPPGITESLYCTVEIIKTLSINYTAIKP